MRMLVQKSVKADSAHAGRDLIRENDFTLAKPLTGVVQALLRRKARFQLQLQPQASHNPYGLHDLDYLKCEDIKM